MKILAWTAMLGLSLSPAWGAEPPPSPSPSVSPVPAQALAPSIEVDRLEASVNGALILDSDIARFRKTMHLRQQLDPLFTGTVVGSAGNNAKPEDIVQFLIDEKLVSQQFAVSDTDVEQEINSIQSNNHIDRIGLKSALKDQGFSFEDYFELIRSSASKRNLIDRDIRAKATVSDDEVKNYYVEHYPQGVVGDKSYSIKIILVSTSSYKNPAAARDVADKALKDISAGESFEEVAKRASDDSSASSGGDLGTMTEDQMSPGIRSEVKKLKVGEISPVLPSGTGGAGGFMIIKLVDIKTGDGPKVAKIHDEIRQQLTASEYQHQIQLWLQRQRQASFIHIAGQSSALGIPSQTP